MGSAGAQMGRRCAMRLGKGYRSKLMAPACTRATRHRQSCAEQSRTRRSLFRDTNALTTRRGGGEGVALHMLRGSSRKHFSGTGHWYWYWYWYWYCNVVVVVAAVTWW